MLGGELQSNKIPNRKCSPFALSEGLNLRFFRVKQTPETPESRKIPDLLRRGNTKILWPFRTNFFTDTSRNTIEKLVCIPCKLKIFYLILPTVNIDINKIIICFKDLTQLFSMSLKFALRYLYLFEYILYAFTSVTSAVTYCFFFGNRCCLVVAVLASLAMVLVQQVTKNAKAMVPFLKPIWAFGIAFSITGYLIWKIPISGWLLVITFDG